jgi:hypothetical protein
MKYKEAKTGSKCFFLIGFEHMPEKKANAL